MIDADSVSSVSIHAVCSHGSGMPRLLVEIEVLSITNRISVSPQVGLTLRGRRDIAEAATGSGIPLITPHKTSARGRLGGQ